MAKLNDTQIILLSTAAQRDSGSLYPLPQVRAPKVTVVKAIAALLGAGLVDERETKDSGAEHRNDGDLRFGLYVTLAGLQAIGIESEPGGPGEPVPSSSPSAMSAPAPRQTKGAAVLALLSREDGATLPELIAATGWLPHTTRAALTGLRKKGHAIERGKREGVTCYRIASAA